MLNVGDAIADHWPQQKVKILGCVFRESLQTCESKKWEDTKSADKTITNSLLEEA